MRTLALVVFALLGWSVAPAACSPQVVDAVDSSIQTGGVPNSGGVAGSTGGDSGASGMAGTGVTCPDGSSDDADRDGDGSPDCLDSCPEDANKTEDPGRCGCGLPDSVPDGGPTCADLVAVLAHRYTFEGTGTTVVDSAPGGDADGEVIHTELTGKGTLALAGTTSDQYVTLPNRLLSRLVQTTRSTGSVTLEAWLRWTGGAVWQRIFDFGDNDGPAAGEQGTNGNSYLFLTPRTPLEPDLTVWAPQNAKLRVAYKRPGTSEYEVTLDAPIALPSGVDTHVAVVIDGTLQRMSLYVDGKLQNGIAYFRDASSGAFSSTAGVYDWSSPVPSGDGGTVMPPAIDLSLVNDINNWLGRSQFAADAELQGSYYEFRVYSAALSPELVAISFKGGPDAVFLQ